MAPDLSQEDLQKLLSGGPRRAHLVGVSGSGMSGLARLLAQRGHEVTGSDLGGETDTEEFKKLGIRRFRGHAAEHVVNPDFVCYSSAIPGDNPELLEAERRGIPVVRRARALAALVPPQQAVVISGTHGKTTTTSMVALLLRAAGRDPSWFVGAHVPNLGSNAHAAHGAHFVIEADESDGTMSEFRPQDLLILNIEAEHLDFYDDLAAIERAFEGLARLTKGRVIHCADDPGAARVCAKLPKSVPYSVHKRLSAEGGWWAGNIHVEDGCSRFEVWCGKECLGPVTLRVPGLHNVSNAVAAMAMAFDLGVEFGVAATALGEFEGARRRFEKLFESDRFLVVDDYAHHPSEVQATIQAARQKGRRRVVAVFQPHRYSRTKALHRDFGRVLAAADRVFLTDVYAASEMPIEGVDGGLIADAARAASVEHAKELVYDPNLWRMKEQVGADIREGDLVLVMGAGNISQVSRMLADELRVHDDLCRLLKASSVVKRYEPMAKRTSMRTGGFAKLWIEPSDEEDLAKILRYCHDRAREVAGDPGKLRLVAVTFVGRGSNLLVRDAGISGVTIHLGGEAFSRIVFEGERVRVGAGARLKHVVMAAKKENLTGLEFLEGIPGSVGGALYMNAGAMGSCTFDVVESVRLMDMSGAITERKPAELQVEYRACRGLRGHVALSAVLKARRGDPVEIAAKLREFEQKRWSSQPAAPSAGCIFKNPKEIAAGRVIDELGLKGSGFGHARVSEEHGNFIVNDGGATSSDVLGLISIIRDRVRQERGIELETEVVVIGDERW